MHASYLLRCCVGSLFLHVVAAAKSQVQKHLSESAVCQHVGMCKKVVLLSFAVPAEKAKQQLEAFFKISAPSVDAFPLPISL